MTHLSSNPDATIQIRRLKSGDQIPADLPTPGPDEDTPRWRRSRIALDGEQIVGTASIVLAPVTDSYFCEVNVLPSHRRQGIGTQLYAAIHQLTDSDYPVLTRAMSSQPLRRAFAESLGCSVRTHCPEPWIDPPSDEAQHWIAEQQLPAGYTVEAMAGQPSQKILEAWTTYCVWTHQPFGPVHADQVPQAWEGYSTGLDPAASMVALDQTGTIVAFSFVSPDVWDGRTMIVPKPSKPTNQTGRNSSKPPSPRHYQFSPSATSTVSNSRDTQPTHTHPAS